MRIESETSLIESIMSDVRAAMWEALPSSANLKEVAQAKGKAWRTVAARWTHDGVLHYEAIAATTVGRSPHVVRLPPVTAEQVWMLYENSRH